jgi:hypothetical protein
METIRRNIHSSRQQNQRQAMEHSWSPRKGESTSPVNQSQDRCEVYHYDARYDRIKILEKSRNQNQYSEERRKKERQNEEDPHWREQQNCYDERRFGRRYGEDQWEINQQPRPARLDFPKFDGDNPTRWIYKVEQFFEHYQTLERRKLKIAEFNMEGEALNWFQHSEECGYFHNWKSFTDALSLRFEPTCDDRNGRMQYHDDRNARMSYQSSGFAMAEGTQMTHCADSLKQYEEVQAQDHQNQREELPESIKKLIATTKMMLSRSNKLRQGKQAAEEYEDQIPGVREIKDFQEPENLRKGRNKLFEERRTIEKFEVFGEQIKEEKIGCNGISCFLGYFL